MRSTAAEKGINLVACETIVDHAHLLLDVPDRPTLSRAMNLLKGISSRRMTAEFPELRLDTGVPTIWQHRFASKEIPAAATKDVVNYIRSQWDRLEKYER
jgi:putative transposase